MTGVRTVAVAYLDRPQARGALRRAEGLQAVLQAAGLQARLIPVPLLSLPHAARNRPLRKIRDLVRLQSALPVLLWDEDDLLRRLDDSDADVVILSTTRMWSRRVAAHLPVALDYIDMLSASYGDRSQLSTKKHQALYRSLASIARHEESQVRKAGIATMADGYRDSELLGSTWIPITYDWESLPAGHPDHDLVFFGSLHYPPNVAAIKALHLMWPELVKRRPGISALIAGSNATPEVLRMVAERHWTYVADFADVRDVVTRAHISVAPLPVASGIQTKVLEAAALGVPQVISEAAAAGMAPGFPAVVGKVSDFPKLIVELLTDAERMAELRAQGPAVMARQYSSAAWAGPLRRLVETARRC